MRVFNISYSSYESERLSFLLNPVLYAGFSHSRSLFSFLIYYRFCYSLSLCRNLEMIAFINKYIMNNNGPALRTAARDGLREMTLKWFIELYQNGI
jgi:hypothetical protein